MVRKLYQKKWSFNKKEEILESERHQNGTTRTVKDFFSNVLNEFPEIKDIDKKLIGNFDETMLELGKKKKYALYQSNKRRYINKGAY